MEIQLQELIEQIKKDGVEAAEASAARILNDANSEAEKIISDAKAHADRIIANAKAENERFVRAGEDAIRQATRNLLLTFRESVTKELAAIVVSDVKAAYSSDMLIALVPKVVEAFAENTDADSITVLLSSKDLQALESAALASLKSKISKGITLKANDSLGGGFRICADDSGVYYDYSAEAVAQMLSTYLSPKINALMKEADKA